MRLETGKLMSTVRSEVFDVRITKLYTARIFRESLSRSKLHDKALIDKEIRDHVTRSNPKRDV